MTTVLTIGRLAQTVGVNIQTIRYYERRRLLTPNKRRPSGYRLYDHEARRRLQFIKNAKALGFTLQEIGDLLDLRVSDKATPAACDTKHKPNLTRSRVRFKTSRLWLARCRAWSGPVVPLSRPRAARYSAAWSNTKANTAEGGDV